jgi:hypothetical protein
MHEPSNTTPVWLPSRAPRFHLPLCVLYDRLRLHSGGRFYSRSVDDGLGNADVLSSGVRTVGSPTMRADGAALLSPYVF